jgi:uncharacterized protein (TIGR00661 family)
MFFAYGESLKLLQRFSNNENIKIVEVFVPYLIADVYGIDFTKSFEININSDISINLKAFSLAQQWIGKPDIIISDYEPTSAQYGYSYNVKIITFDQQSKFFLTGLPYIDNYSYIDEVMRLRMFFPVAKRIACSFFKIEGNEEVSIVPCIYRDNIKNLTRIPKNNHYIVYLSAQLGFTQKLEEFVSILDGRTEIFHIFFKDIENFNNRNNLKFYKHGNSEFDEILSLCNGVISTAGHTLLSECMFLGIPVFALPLKLYEQQLNAFEISSNGFGMSSEFLSHENLNLFINNIDIYQENINNNNVLNRIDGKEIIINMINKYLK